MFLLSRSQNPCTGIFASKFPNIMIFMEPCHYYHDEIASYVLVKWPTDMVFELVNLHFYLNCPERTIEDQRWKSGRLLQASPIWINKSDTVCQLIYDIIHRLYFTEKWSLRKSALINCLLEEKNLIRLKLNHILLSSSQKFNQKLNFTVLFRNFYETLWVLLSLLYIKESWESNAWELRCDSKKRFSNKNSPN